MLNLLRKKRRGNSDTEVETLLFRESNFAASEAYKLLRTNLMFTLPDEGKCRIVGVTSSIRGEGKSTTSLNLSYVLAETGKKVLLLDADLRLPSIAKKLKISGEPGLSEALISQEHGTESIQKLTLDNWQVLPSGSIPPNPSEMLGSPQMSAYLTKLSESYDFIIVDLPPVNIVSDALALSSVLDGMIVVVRSNYSERRELHKCLKSLELSGVKLLGLVMNAKRLSGLGSTKYRKYKKDYYAKNGYESADDKKADTELTEK